MKTNKQVLPAAVLLAAVLLAALAPAQSAAAEEAADIVARADAPYLGGRIYGLSTMIITRAGEARPAMELESYAMTVEGRDASLTIYRAPAKMKGTAYLMIDDDLWVRFASSGRTRKLSSSARKNAAGGSDFSYYDMGDSGRGIAADYETLLEDDRASVGGIRCYRVALIPRAGKDIPYERLTAYISYEDYHYLKIDYTQDGAEIKSLTFSDYRRVDGRDYPFRYVMESHVKPSSTEVVTTLVEFDSPRVEAGLFTVPYLEQVR
jgi:hypothetical protein